MSTPTTTMLGSASTGRLAEETGVTSSCSSPTASPSDNAMVNVVDLAGSTVPTGFSLPPSALSKVLDTWRPPCVAFTSG
jgi:hypothetical protein